MKVMQILLLGSAFVMSSAYANEGSKDYQVVPAKHEVVADSHEKTRAAESKHESVAEEKQHDKHDVLRTKFLGKRPYM